MDIKLFTKQGCVPCVIAKRLAETITDVDIIDIGINGEYIDEYGLTCVPTLLNNGELITNPSDITDILQKQ